MVVAGSTHEGEDEAVLDAYRRVVDGPDDLVLLLAPRHPERIPRSRRRCARGLPARPLQRARAPTRRAVDVARRRRAARRRSVRSRTFYALGHDRVRRREPRARSAATTCSSRRGAGRPVLVGPHTTNASEIVDRLVAGGAAMRVSSTDSLAWALAGCSTSRSARRTWGASRALVETGQGAVERHLKVIARAVSR
jgi:3-deoxy-D-manno-octulosonic-acid transferase